MTKWVRWVPSSPALGASPSRGGSGRGSQEPVVSSLVKVEGGLLETWLLWSETPSSPLAKDMGQEGRRLARARRGYLLGWPAGRDRVCSMPLGPAKFRPALELWAVFPNSTSRAFTFSETQLCFK